MVSREFIYLKVKFHHVVAIHMNGDIQLGKDVCPIYIVHDVVLEKCEEKLLLSNIQNKIDSDGVLRIKASRTSRRDFSLEDNEIKEYLIDTKDIEYYEVVD